MFKLAIFGFKAKYASSCLAVGKGGLQRTLAHLISPPETKYRTDKREQREQTTENT